MGDVIDFACPESDADAWTAYGGCRDGERVIFALFDEAANARLRDGDQTVQPQLYATMTAAKARRIAETLLIASISVEPPDDLPPEVNARIRNLLSTAGELSEHRENEGE